MLTVKKSTKSGLRDIVDCHMKCFPASLATQLGKNYVQKSLEWFFANPDRFLFHVKNSEEIIGYCGGFKPVKLGDGSSSGMLQYAFNEAIKGILRKPLLLFHPEVRQHYPFLWMNIKRRITGRVKPMQPHAANKPFKPFGSLVVIGVHPDHRGNGIAQILLKEFEKQVGILKQHEMILSVKKDNGRAIRAYKNFGWTIKKETPRTCEMTKQLPVLQRA